jgi:hypothetical protein
MLAPILIMIGLTIVQWLTGSRALALIFPWRISTWIVPIASSILIAVGLDRLFQRFPGLETRYARLVQRLAIALLVVVVLVGAVRLVLDFRRKSLGEDRALYQHIAARPDSKAVYLIPVKMQDFRLAAGAAVYVDFKAIPYRDSDVLEWHRRLTLADSFYKTGDCQLLAEFSQEGVNRIVVDGEIPELNCEGLVESYQDGSYRVLEIVEPETAGTGE